MSTKPYIPIKVSLGKLLMTCGAQGTLNWEDMINALNRHVIGDWGDVCDEDWKANDQALQYGSRILSAYSDRLETRFWIITEADRSATTILLPEEY